MSEVEVVGRGPMSQREALDILTGGTYTWDPRLQTMAISVAVNALYREVVKNEKAEIVDCEYVEV